MTTTPRPTPHLFADWDLIRRRIRGSKRLVMFLDFDGTLVRVAPTPHQVRVERATRAALKKLARHRGVTLVVISGRRRAELQRHIGLPNVKYLGLYGWEANGNMSLPFSVREALACTMMDLVVRIPKTSSVWAEPKGGSFSVHLLGASAETRRQVRVLVQKLVRPHRGTLKVMMNLRDLEVAPLSIGDKGVGVRKFLDQPAQRGALPIYFGDDLSDEPGFVAARAGISVLVGKRRKTRAKFSLRGPAEVTKALSRVEEIVRWTGQPRRSNSTPSPI
jgi:trehalose 6-phosphate phosphatase